LLKSVRFRLFQNLFSADNFREFNTKHRSNASTLIACVLKILVGQQEDTIYTVKFRFYPQIIIKPTACNYKKYKYQLLAHYCNYSRFSNNFEIESEIIICLLV
jgi:hypothetical protein